MADVISCAGLEGLHLRFTFPVRGIFASRSTRELQWLLSLVPNSSLTVWSDKLDALKLRDLLRIRSSFPKHRVYYDVPDAIYKKFQEKKNSVNAPSSDVLTRNNQWMLLASDQSDICSALTYVGNEAIVFGKSSTTAVVLRNPLKITEDSSLTVTGHVRFFNADGQDISRAARKFQEVMLVLVDANLLTKTVTENSKNEYDGDAEVIWSAVNSSAVHVFRHDFLSDDLSCRFFRLETSLGGILKLWTSPCGAELEVGMFSESAVTEFSSGKKLDQSFLFGVVSSGDEHVVLYNLHININDRRENLVSRGTSTSKMSMASLSVVTALCSFSLLLSRRYCFRVSSDVTR